MACLLPQFKCPSETNLLPKSFLQLHFKSRENWCFRAQCMLSSTIVLGREKLQVPPFDSISASVPSIKPLSYTGTIGPPLKETFDKKMAAESLLANEEAVIEAAAAEAVALARAAVEMAQQAAQMVGRNSLKKGKAEHAPSAVNVLQLETARFFAMEPDETVNSTVTVPQRDPSEDLSLSCSSLDAELGILVNENNLLEIDDSEAITVRSKRQADRRARRSRAEERLSVSIPRPKYGYHGRKKRVSSQDFDISDPLRFMRGTTSTARVLTSAEEVELSSGIQDLLKLERIHDELVKRYDGQPTMEQWAAAAGVDKETLRKRLNYGCDCKSEMIKNNIRLVISIAKNYRGVGMALEDLIQDGCRGLVKGVEKFDASKGFRFSTYAHWWIRQAIRKSLSNHSRTIRLPLHMVESLYKVKVARKKFYNENRRYPGEEELAEATGLSLKRVQAVLVAPRAPQSLDQKVGPYQDTKPSDVIADPNAESLDVLVMKQHMRQDLHKVLDALRPRERKVVSWRFGLEDGRMKTLQEIGESMGVSRERVRQIEACAFRKLKKKKKSLQLHTVIL